MGKRSGANRHKPAAQPPRHVAKGLLSVALVVLSGTLHFLSFAGFGLWWLSFVCLVPMLLAFERVAKLAPIRTVGLGMVHGFVSYAGGYYWLVDMLETFSGYGPVPSAAFASIFFFFQSLQMTAVAWLFRRARDRGWPAWVALTAGLCGLELAFPALFPSFFANAYHQLPYMIQTADLGGPILVSAVGIAINGALFEAMCALRDRRALPTLPLAVSFGGLALTLAYGAYRVSEVDARSDAAKPLTVGLVQVNMGIFSKREDPFEGHRRHLEQSLELERDVQPDLIIWPESAYMFGLPEQVTNIKARVIGPLNTPVLFGGLARRRGPEGAQQFNTAYMAEANGDITGTYDKTYLLAFGEYMPFGDWFPVLYDWSPNSGHFTPGDHQNPLPLGEHRITTLICYEDVLPGFTRQAVAKGNPHLLVNITNDAWFGDTQEPWIHLALAKFRAVEHHRYLARATNSGVSAVVDPVGRVITHSGVSERATLNAQVRALDGSTVYQHVGDWPGWLGLIAILAMAFRRRAAAPLLAPNAALMLVAAAFANAVLATGCGNPSHRGNASPSPVATATDTAQPIEDGPRPVQFVPPASSQPPEPQPPEPQPPEPQSVERGVRSAGNQLVVRDPPQKPTDNDRGRLRAHIDGGLSTGTVRNWIGPPVPQYVALAEGNAELFLLENAPEGIVAFYREPYGAGSCALGTNANCRYHARLYRPDQSIAWTHELNQFFSRDDHLEVQDVRFVGGVLYWNEACQSYSAEAGGQCSSLVAFDPKNARVLWRSRNRTSNNVFLVLDRYIVSGYGFTAEPDFLFLIDRATGRVRHRARIPAAHEWLELVSPGRLKVEYYYQKTAWFELKALDSNRPRIRRER